MSKPKIFVSVHSPGKMVGAFSYSKSHVSDVIRYVQNQEIHHRKETFLDEYRHMLNPFEIEYDEQYIFKELLQHKTFLRNEKQKL